MYTAHSAHRVDDKQWRTNGHVPNGVDQQRWQAKRAPASEVSPWANERISDRPYSQSPSSFPLQSSLKTVLGTSTSSKPSLTKSPDPTGSLVTPAMMKFLLLCSLWYTSSAMSSNTGKSIMNQFKYPVTLTIVQFFFVSGYCLVFANPWFGFTTLRRPTQAIIRNTLPMAVFQVGGHVFSSMAISRVPVSTVHTIKALSPLFTVAAYAVLFGVRYSARTYISLLPLTFGVMLACSFDLSLNNALGLACAFGSAIVFVTSNIFFKKIMPSPSSGAASVTPNHKLDKLNLLFYSSGLAFLLMIPIWVWSDLGRLLRHDHLNAVPNGKAPPAHGVMYYFFMNGTVHWAQNIIAFAILSITSPVTYSIASLVKRIVVICIAIVWFSQTIHLIQGVGIGLTFVGLWMYNSAKADVERGENKMRIVEARRDMALPLTKADAELLKNTPRASPNPESQEWAGRTGVSSAVDGAYSQQIHHHHSHSAGPKLSPAILQPFTQSTDFYAPPAPYSHVYQGAQQHPGRLDTNIALTTPVKSGGVTLAAGLPSPPASLDSPPSAHSYSLQSPVVEGERTMFSRRGTINDGHVGLGLTKGDGLDASFSPRQAKVLVAS